MSPRVTHTHTKAIEFWEHFCEFAASLYLVNKSKGNWAAKSASALVDASANRKICKLGLATRFGKFCSFFFAGHNRVFYSLWVVTYFCISWAVVCFRMFVFFCIFEKRKEGRNFCVFKNSNSSLELRTGKTHRRFYWQPAKRGKATPKDKGADFPSHPYQCVSSDNFLEYCLQLRLF